MTPPNVWYKFILTGYMWPGSAEAGPALQHAIQVVADGVSWLDMDSIPSNPMVLIGPGIIFTGPLPNEAPARTLVEQTAALAAEHGSTFAKNTMSSSGTSKSNVTCSRSTCMIPKTGMFGVNPQIYSISLLLQSCPLVKVFSGKADPWPIGGQIPIVSPSSGFWICALRRPFYSQYSLLETYWSISNPAAGWVLMSIVLWVSGTRRCNRTPS